MSDLASLQIWDDPGIRGALSWYLAVAENGRPAKFRIAATVATQLDLAASSEDALWAELERLTPTFLERWQSIRAGAPLPPPPILTVISLSRSRLGTVYRQFTRIGSSP
jgi:putative pyruvate formate lyase activating enzyme